MTHTGLPSHIGFDDIRFRVLESGDGVYPDWRIEPTIITRHIPGSNRAIIQHMGTPPATLTLRLAFDDVPTYRRMVARLGTNGTLTLLANFTSAVGTTFHRHGRDYEAYSATMLVGVDRTAIDPDGMVETDMTFQRAFNPVTGTAVSS